ncbi:MAG TPA: hypothetical protein VG963_26600 [Polyangiaceae bacterium]|nr:hypothetical protein [Polyangiaceae bacterium]
MPRGNPSLKLAISMDPDTAARVQEAAEAEGSSVSAWITRAAQRTLRIQDGLRAVAEWEAEHGAFTEEELEEGRKKLGLSGVKPEFPLPMATKTAPPRMRAKLPLVTKPVSDSRRAARKARSR